MNLFSWNMERLHVSTLGMVALVEEMVRDSARSLCDVQTELAHRVAAGETLIDRLGVGIEEECLRILALHDPVASDLHRVLMVLKVNHELEQIVNLSVGIAKRVMAFALEDSVVPIPKDLRNMGSLAVDMVRDSLAAFIDTDADRARAVIKLDGEVNRLQQALASGLKQVMKNTDEYFEAALHLLSAVNRLDRITDHATNVAEEVIYSREGIMIRHQGSADTTPSRRASASSRHPIAAPGAPV